ncbi:amidase family protein [Actinokineospora enzanensis]|uniref:amidase family protein n=1 Tax=Actinokineospora enzanensis TaxID=155975 RepID=UPI00146F11C4|nr:amidase family protein [Actinokineospora enzanensis]
MTLAMSTAANLLRMLAAGELSSTELLEHHLELVRARNPAVNAVVALDETRARAAARRADDAHARGESLGPLHGLPMTVKDVFETAGLVTTAGSADLAAHVPATDAEAVARLRAAGAVIFGKTNVPPYAGDLETASEPYGLTRNPWDPTRTPGGSSGGSAAALAAGLTPLELGSDIAGSIRLPSHFCGVYGHLPTFGAVPTRGHIPGAPGSLATSPLGVVGPMGLSPGDLALTLSVLVGRDLACVPGGALPPAGDCRLKGLRIAVWLDNPIVRTSREVKDVLRGLVDQLSDLGAMIDRRPRPPRPFYEAYETYFDLLLGVMSSDFPEPTFRRLTRIATAARPDDDRPVVRLARAVAQPFRQWRAAEERRARIAAAWESLFDDIDLVLTPVAPTTARPHQTDVPPLARELVIDGRPTPYFGQVVWATLASSARLPATVVPVGASGEGLPIGAQLIGPRWSDLTLLTLADRITATTGSLRLPTR